MRGSQFFDGVAQSDVIIAGQPAKMPIFYYDGSAISAVFAARLGALRRLMPDPRIAPARLAPGLGAIAVTCFEYRDTDIGEYNELAISVVLNEPWFLPNIPGRALLASLRKRQLNAWIHHLPVTTEIALAGGREYYNYPKFVAGIDFEENSTERTCRLSDGGEHILTLTGKRIATPRAERFQLFSHLWMDRQPQSSEFAINAHSMGVTIDPRAAGIQLGSSHPIARELAGLIAWRSPIQFQYIPSFEGVLYGPEHFSLPLLDKIAEMSAKGSQAAGAAAPAKRDSSSTSNGNGRQSSPATVN